MSKSLQEQLLKKGLISNKKLKAVSKDKYRALKDQRRKKASSAPQAQNNIQETRLQQKARDRELNLQQKAKADRKALAAQIIQLVGQYKLERESAEIEYNFSDGNIVKKILVTQSMSKEISHGRLCITKFGESYEIIPKPIADKIRERDPSVIVVYIQEERNQETTGADSNEAYYAQFEIPDDLIW